MRHPSGDTYEVRINSMPLSLCGLYYVGRVTLLITNTTEWVCIPGLMAQFTMVNLITIGSHNNPAKILNKEVSKSYKNM